MMEGGRQGQLLGFLRTIWRVCEVNGDGNLLIMSTQIRGKGHWNRHTSFGEMKLRTSLLAIHRSSATLIYYRQR
jgi:hypothetical protein